MKQQALKNKYLECMAETIRGHIYYECGRIGVYRFAEWDSRQRLAYGFGANNVYAYSDILNVNKCLPPHLKLGANETCAIISNLKALQDPITGLFHEGSHHEIHTTACAFSALHRYGDTPNHGIPSLCLEGRSTDICSLLDNVRWDVNPWRDSNMPAGLLTLTILMKSHDKSDVMENSFFKWLDENLDSHYGFWKLGGLVTEDKASTFPYIAAAFHFLFLYSFTGTTFTHQRELYKQCEPYLTDDRLMGFCKEPGYIEIDCIYCVIYYLRRNKDELAGRLLVDFTSRYLNGLATWFDNLRSSDLHKLAGSMALYSELESYFLSTGEASEAFLPDSMLSSAPYI